MELGQLKVSFSVPAASGNSTEYRVLSLRVAIATVSPLDDCTTVWQTTGPSAVVALSPKMLNCDAVVPRANAQPHPRSAQRRWCHSAVGSSRQFKRRSPTLALKLPWIDFKDPLSLPAISRGWPLTLKNFRSVTTPVVTVE